MGSLNSENIQQFCRACLRHLFKKQPQQPEMQNNEPSFYHVDRTQDLNKWISILNPLEEANNTNSNRNQYAKYVCRSCYENFKHVNDFREMVLHSYSVMTKLLNTAEKKEETPKTKEDIVIEEIQIKSEPIDNDDDYMVNDWQMEDVEESVTNNANYYNAVEQQTEEDDDDDDDDGICKELVLPSVANQTLVKDHIKKDSNSSVSRKAGNKCSLPHCRRSKRSSPNVKLFRFPNMDSPLFKKWAEKCNFDEQFIANSSSLFLCDKHFSSELIGKKFLRRGAVPSLYLTENNEDMSVEGIEVYSENDLQLFRSPPQTRRGSKSPSPLCTNCEKK